MRWIASAAIATTAALLTVSCVAVLPIDGAASAVPTNEIVRRIKCELIEAVQKRSEDPRLSFLSQWSATVDLTRVVDGSASVNPGTTISSPVPKGTFSLGVGAGITTQAVRTDQMRFFIAFPEVTAELASKRRKATYFDDCNFSQGFLLDSYLGIGEAIDRAVDPIRGGTLSPIVGLRARGGGVAARPAGEAENIKRSLEQLKSIRFPDTKTIDLNFTIQKNIDPKLNNFLEQLQKEKGPETSDIVGKNIVEAARIETETRSIITNIVTPLYDLAQTGVSPKCLKDINDAKFKSVTWSAVVSLRKIDVDRAKDAQPSNEALQKERQAFDSTIENAKIMVEKISSCPIEQDKPPTPIIYDPIDTISETINFNITSAGSITPTWKLVRVTAPLSPTFISGSRKDTNTLILTLGRPVYQADGKAAPSTMMTQQSFTSILSQAFSNRSP